VIVEKDRNVIVEKNRNVIVENKKKYNISGTYKTMGYCKEEKGGMVKKRHI
jgi:hypothetical protein